MALGTAPEKKSSAARARRPRVGSRKHRPYFTNCMECDQRGYCRPCFKCKGAPLAGGVTDTQRQMVVLRLIGCQGSTVWVAKDKKVVSLPNLTDPLGKQLAKILEKLGAAEARGTPCVYAVASKPAATKWKGPPDALALVPAPLGTSDGLSASGVKDNGDFLFVHVDGGDLPAWAGGAADAPAAPASPATPRTPQTPSTRAGPPPPPPPPPPAVVQKAAPPASPHSPLPSPARTGMLGGGRRPAAKTVAQLQQEEMDRIAQRKEAREREQRTAGLPSVEELQHRRADKPHKLAELPSPPRKLQPPAAAPAQLTRRSSVLSAVTTEGGLSSAVSVSTDGSDSSEEEVAASPAPRGSMYGGGLGRLGRLPSQLRVQPRGAAEVEREAAQREVAAMRDALQEMKRQLQGERARAQQNEELRAAVKSLAANASAADEAQQEMAAQIAAGEERNALLEKQLAAQRDELAALHAQHRDLNTQHAAAVADAHALATDLDATRQQAAAAAADAAAAKEAHAETEDELRELRAWAEETHEYVTSQEAVVVEAEGMKAELASAKAEAEALKEEAAKLRLQNTAKTREVAKLAAALQAAQALIAKQAMPPPPPRPSTADLQQQRLVAGALAPPEVAGRDRVTAEEARAWDSLLAFATPLRWATERAAFTPQTILSWQQQQQVLG